MTLRRFGFQCVCATSFHFVPPPDFLLLHELALRDMSSPDNRVSRVRKHVSPLVSVGGRDLAEAPHRIRSPMPPRSKCSTRRVTSSPPAPGKSRGIGPESSSLGVGVWRSAPVWDSFQLPQSNLKWNMVEQGGAFPYTSWSISSGLVGTDGSWHSLARTHPNH